MSNQFDTSFGKPDIEPQNPVKVTYTNYRGVTSIRTVCPVSIHFGSNEWHPDPQWLMNAYDVSKRAQRTFALRDCDFTILSNPVFDL